MRASGEIVRAASVVKLREAAGDRSSVGQVDNSCVSASIRRSPPYPALGPPVVGTAALQLSGGGQLQPGRAPVHDLDVTAVAIDAGDA